MKKTFLTLLTVLFILFIYLFFMISQALYKGDGRFVKDKTITLTGHRGAGGLAPENTLAAIQKGLDCNVDRIEIDVQQTKDNVVISLHDISIDRTTDGKGLVKDLTYKEILKYSGGIKFAEEFKNEKIPTLNQVLKLVNGKATLVVEIKEGDDYYPGIEQRVVNSIKRYNAKSWVIIHSFNDKALEKVKEIDKTIELHKVFIADFPLFSLIYDVKFNITNLEHYDYVTEISTFYPLTTQRLIDKVHSLNKKINVWTVNDSVKINRLINMGVDGIITDYPDYFNRKNN